mmetsp:Transcript_39604/g.51067  ORF Transcript_39604/g.51067 Transcript_39604/m.51067 type:complete len:90 (-) Transcript_39604:152-421(-)
MAICEETVAYIEIKLGVAQYAFVKGLKCQRDAMFPKLSKVVPINDDDDDEEGGGGGRRSNSDEIWFNKAANAVGSFLHSILNEKEGIPN